MMPHVDDMAAECAADGPERPHGKVLAPGHTITEETVAIASAIYWSWWRARDMHGEAP